MASSKRTTFDPRALINAYPQYFLLGVVLLIGLLGMPFSTWVTLTVAGLGMGLMIFVMASGMTLTFGLMDVLNLGHGALITVGAFFGATMVTGLETGHWPLKFLAGLDVHPAPQMLWGMGAFFASLLAAAAVCGVVAVGASRINPGLRSADHGRQMLVVLLGNLAAGGALWGTWGGAVSGSWPGGLAAVLAALAAGLIASWLAGRYRALRKLPPVYGSGLVQAILGLIGAGAAVLAILGLHLWGGSHRFIADMGIVVPALIVASIGVGVVGLVFERLIIRPVYRDPLKQILVTVGAAYIIGELLKAFWGPGQIPMTQPGGLSGGLTFGNITVEKYRLVAGGLGLVIYWLLKLIINRTKVGLLIRAGVENTEMVEALGYRIKLLFICVFVAGAVLAGIGGVMWGLYQNTVGVGLGAEMLVLIIIVIIIGGMGSIPGCFYGALMVGLLNNYTVYMLPDVALFSSILLMVVVLMWRPEGLKPLLK